jgi:excisionase family DNA binding protein
MAYTPLPAIVHGKAALPRSRKLSSSLHSVDQTARTIGVGYINLPPLSLSVDQATKAIGIGRTKLYELLASGHLDAIKIGRRTLITTASLQRLVQGAKGAE